MALKIVISGSEGKYSRFGEMALNDNFGCSQRVKYSRIPRIRGHLKSPLPTAENDGGAMQMTMFHVKQPG